MAKIKQLSRWEKTKLENLRYLPQIGSSQTQAKDFARIRGWGDKNTATTFDNLKVERMDFIYAEGYGLVKTCPYELHFVYEDKSKKIGRWSHMCTCGSIAGIISYKEIKSLMTIEGEHGYILACVAHTASKQNTGLGTHADGSHE